MLSFLRLQEGHECFLCPRGCKPGLDVTGLSQCLAVSLHTSSTAFRLTFVLAALKLAVCNLAEIVDCLNAHAVAIWMVVVCHLTT